MSFWFGINLIVCSFWILQCFQQALGCTSKTLQYKRPGDNVTIQFQAWTVNAVDSSLYVTNQILSNTDSPLLSVLYQNGVMIHKTTCNNCTFTGNANTGELSIRRDNLQTSDGGTYKLTVEQDSKEQKGCVLVYILGQPTKPIITINKVPFEGGNTILTCRSSSTTTPSDQNLQMSYNWTLNNSNIPNDSRYTYSSSGDKLTISYVSRNDANKQFTCTSKEDVSNAYISARSDSLKFDVYYRPEHGPLIQSLSQVFNNNTQFNAIINRKQTLDCSVIGGYPLPSLSWSGITGTEQYFSSGQTITKRLTWTASSNGTCKCTSIQMGATSDVVLNVRILSLPTSPQFWMNSREVQASSTVKIIKDSTTPIYCSSYSSPSPEYKWTYNGQTTEVSQGARLNPSQVTKDGPYYCYVENIMIPSLGSPENGNNSAFINIERLFEPSKPQLRYHDQSGPILSKAFLVVKGENLRLHCSSTGNPLPNYLWTGDERSIHEQDIIVSDIQQDRTYMCKATNRINPTFFSSVTRSSSSTVSINVLSPATQPTITYHYSQIGSESITSTLKVIKGKSFRVSCTSTGIPTPTLSWSGQTSSNTNTLVITSIERNGSFICTAINYMNRTYGMKETVQSKTDLQIEILYGPIVKPFKVEPIIEGSTLSVECKADPGNPVSIIYSWKRILNKTSSNQWQDILESSFNRGQLIKQNIDRSDAGTYKCIASNVMKPTAENQQQGKSFQTFLLDVLYPASIISFAVKGHEGNSSVIIEEHDEEIQMICEVDSNPASTIKISFNGDVIKELSGMNHAFITFRSVTCLDSGDYSCEGRNNIGQTSHKILRLFIKCAPRPLHRIIQTVSSSPNMQVILSFTALAYPNPSAKGFSWYKENRGNDWTQVLANTDLRISSTSVQSNLTILNVTRNDYGRYKLITKNYLGTYVQYFNLTEITVDKGEPERDAICDQFDNNNAIITGIALGIIIALLAGYGVFITIVYKRRYLNEGVGREDRISAKTTYMNISYNTSQQEESETNYACAQNIPEEEVKYTDLTEYSREDKKTYDILRSQNL